MLVLIGSLGIGILVGAIAGFAVGPVAGLFPGVIAAAAAFLLVNRAISKRIEGAMMAVQKELQKGPKHIDNAVRLLEKIKADYGKMVFFTAASIDAQIGSLYFMRGDKKKSQPFLENAFVRVWSAKGMLAVLYAKKKQFDEVDKILEKATKYSPKQGLLWSLWAYLHLQASHRDRAVEILNKGKDILGESDQHLTQNLLLVQNGKKMKMKPYGDAWYQFQLEQHPQMRKAQRGGNVKFARR